MVDEFNPPDPIELEDGSVEYPDDGFPVVPIEEQVLTPVEVDEEDYTPGDEGDDLDG